MDVARDAGVGPGDAKLSIVVPILQSPSILALFLKSLQDSTPSGHQLILVDDGCCAEARDVIAAARGSLEAQFDLDLIRHATPQGDGAACNAALARTKHAISVRLESDAILQAGWSQALAAPFADPATAAVAGVLLYPQSGGINHAGLTFYEKVARHTFLNARPEALPTKPFDVQTLTFGFTAFRDGAVKEAGGFDELYHQGYDDLDLALRLALAGGRLRVVPDARAYHWELSSGLHRAAGRKRNLAVFWDRWGGKISDDLWTYLEAPLTKALVQLQAQGRGVVGVDLNEDRVGARRFWSDVTDRTGLVLHERLDLAHRAAGDGAIALPLVLGDDGFEAPRPYLFLVDNFVRLRGNHYFFERRARLGLDDLAVDFHGNVVWTQALGRAAWPGEKMR